MPQIHPFAPCQKDALIALWERSVIATHDFLDPKHIAPIKAYLQAFDFGAVPTFCVMNEQELIGFIVLDSDKIDMLFLDPKHIGKGFGRMLMNFVLDNFTINFVNVNEQNHLAKAFYQNYGFVVFNRLKQDDFGYPLLQMKRLG